MLEPFKASFFSPPLGFHLLIFDQVCSLNKYFPNIFQLSKRKKEKPPNVYGVQSIYGWNSFCRFSHLSCPSLHNRSLVKCSRPSYWGMLNTPGTTFSSSISHQDDFLEILKARKMLGRFGSRCLQLLGGRRHWNVDNNLLRDPPERRTYPKWGIVITSLETLWWWDTYF